MSTVTVLTYNLMSGPDFKDLADPVTGGIPAIPAAALPSIIGQLYDRALGSDFPQRARAWATQIASVQPDLIALQEACIWRLNDPARGPVGTWYDPSTGGAAAATTVTIDALALLQAELRAKWMTYTVANEVVELDVQTVGFHQGHLVDVRLTQRLVILAVAPSTTPVPSLPPRDTRPSLRLPLVLGNKRSGLYQDHFAPEVPTGQTIALTHGWLSVDVELPSGGFRFGTTHLETMDPGAHRLQATEFLTLAGADAIWAGDFNSDAAKPVTGTPPGTDTVARIVGAGYVDAWSACRPDAGWTCCNADITAPASTFDRRVDQVFATKEMAVVGCDLLGESPSDRTPSNLWPSGLWPSDHAGVLATYYMVP